MTLTAATLALRKLVEANLGVVERGQGTEGYRQRSPRGLHAASPRRRPAERLASDYSQRISTFTLGYSGGLPSTSTIRMLPSWAWSNRLLLL